MSVVSGPWSVARNYQCQGGAGERRASNADGHLTGANKENGENANVEGGDNSPEAAEVTEGTRASIGSERRWLVAWCGGGTNTSDKLRITKGT